MCEMFALTLNKCERLNWDAEFDLKIALVDGFKECQKLPMTYEKTG